MCLPSLVFSYSGLAGIVPASWAFRRFGALHHVLSRLTSSWLQSELDNCSRRVQVTIQVLLAIEQGLRSGCVVTLLRCLVCMLLTEVRAHFHVFYPRLVLLSKHFRVRGSSCIEDYAVALGNTFLETRVYLEHRSVRNRQSSDGDA